jgi:PKD repeat protein
MSAARKPRRRPGPQATLAAVAIVALVLVGGLRAAGAPLSTVRPAGALSSLSQVPAAPSPSFIFKIEPTWNNVTSANGPTPPALDEGASAYDPTDGTTVIFGGYNAAGAATNATWTFFRGHWTNVTVPSDAPSARAAASMDFDANMGGLLLFGGVGGAGQLLSDTWLYSGGRWTNLSWVGAAPPARHDAMMAFDPQVDENGSVLFGGIEGSGTANDTWIWESWSGWVPLTSSSLHPPPAAAAGFAYDAAQGDLVLYGGSCGFLCVDSETWELYGGEWFPVHPTSTPGPWLGGSLVYDEQLGTLVLFGGANATFAYQSSTWEFDGSTWFVPLVVSAPPARVFDFASADSGPLGPILFGGQDTFGANLNDTWAFEIAPGAGLRGPATAESGAPVTFQLSPVFGSGPFNGTISFGDSASAVVNGSALPWSATHVYGAAGSYTVTANVTDADGLVAPSNAITIVVTAGPTVTVTATPAPVDVHVPVAFAANASPTGTFTFAWSFGDGSTGSGAAPTHSYAEPGVYQANVTATDPSGGQASASVMVDVVAPPVVTLSTAPTSPASGASVELVASVANGSAPFRYQWTFGDGGTSTFASPEHTYSAPGTYTVGVWVNDSGGGATHETLRVTVGAPSRAAGASGPASWLDWALLGVLLAIALVALVLILRSRKPSRP